MAVLAHHVLVEVGVGVAAGGGGEPDDRGVEIIEHLAPEAVDRAVALIHHDHIEEFRWDPGVVHNGLRPPHQGGAMPIKRRLLLQGRIELGLSLKDRIQALNGGDHHLVHRIDSVVAQVDDVVQLVELAAVIGRGVRLELLECLTAQVASIHQKQHTPRTTLRDQPVRRGNGGEGFAAAGGHLEQSPQPPIADARLQVFHGPDLGRPHAGAVELLSQPHPALEGCRQGRAWFARAAPHLSAQPPAEGFGPMEAEHPSCGGIRV